MQAAPALQNTICNICKPDSEKVWERGRCVAVYNFADGCLFNDNANLKHGPYFAFSYCSKSCSLLNCHIEVSRAQYSKCASHEVHNASRNPIHEQKVTKQKIYKQSSIHLSQSPRERLGKLILHSCKLCLATDRGVPLGRWRKNRVISSIRYLVVYSN